MPYFAAAFSRCRRLPPLAIAPLYCRCYASYIDAAIDAAIRRLLSLIRRRAPRSIAR